MSVTGLVLPVELNCFRVANVLAYFAAALMTSSKSFTTLAADVPRVDISGRRWKTAFGKSFNNFTQMQPNTIGFAFVDIFVRRWSAELQRLITPPLSLSLTDALYANVRALD